MKRPIQPEPKTLSAHEDTFARRILSNIAATKPHSTDPRQAMMLEHFNQSPSGRAYFSHYSLGTKLRRYGR